MSYFCGDADRVRFFKTDKWRKVLKAILYGFNFAWAGCSINQIFFASLWPAYFLLYVNGCIVARPVFARLGGPIDYRRVRNYNTAIKKFTSQWADVTQKIWTEWNSALSAVQIKCPSHLRLVHAPWVFVVIWFGRNFETSRCLSLIAEILLPWTSMWE